MTTFITKIDEACCQCLLVALQCHLVALAAVMSQILHVRLLRSSDDDNTHSLSSKPCMQFHLLAATAAAW